MENTSKASNVGRKGDPPTNSKGKTKNKKTKSDNSRRWRLDHEVKRIWRAQSQNWPTEDFVNSFAPVIQELKTSYDAALREDS